MKPKITVLTCVYNGLPYLKEAIDSTLSQSYEDFEYLIIDDCSTDKEVVKFIESYDDPRIHFVKNEVNLGVSKTMNKAFSMIQTPYVVRIDQDDVNLPTRIEEQVDYLENHPDIDIVCSWEHAIDSKGRFLGDYKIKLDNYGEFLGSVLVALCPIWHPSIAFRTKSIVDAGGFKVEYTRAEDFEVTARLALKRYNAAVVQKFHLLQRQHSGSQSKKFCDDLEAVTRRIHEKVIKTFISKPGIEDLSSFLRLERDPNNQKRSKAYISSIDIMLKALFARVKERQKLSDNELKSLKKVVFRRVGVGIKYASCLTRLPSFLFWPAYYLLSFQQLRHVRKYVAILSRYFTGRWHLVRLVKAKFGSRYVNE